MKITIDGIEVATLEPADIFDMAAGKFMRDTQGTIVEHVNVGSASQYLANHPVYSLMSGTQHIYYCEVVANIRAVETVSKVRQVVEEEGIVAAGPWGP
jgi:hypothetical protein